MHTYPINDGIEQDEINLRNGVHQEATATEASTVRKLCSRRQRRRTRIEIRIRVSLITQKMCEAPRRSTCIHCRTQRRRVRVSLHVGNVGNTSMTSVN